MVSIKADATTHMMHLSVREWEKGNLKLKPILCIGWFYFKSPLERDVVKSTVIDGLVNKVFRYQAVPVERDGWTYWEKVEDMDWEYHFGKENSPSFNSDEKWREYLDDIVETGLDYSKPMWKFQLIDKFPCGRSGFLMITDHTFGDGASAVTALLSLCEKTSDTNVNPVFNKRKAKPMRMFTPYETLFAFTKGIFGPLLETILPNDRPTKLKAKHFPQAWDYSLTTPNDSMDLQLFKDIKNKIPGCTVNDVLLALTALSIKSYYKEIGEPIMDSKSDITATYAVNIRPPGVDYLDDYWFGNHFISTSTPYPLHDTRVNTLLKFRDAGRMRKMSLDNAVRNTIVKLAAKLVPYVNRPDIMKIIADLNLKFSIMISNVLLSTERLNLFGQEIDNMQFLVMSPLGCYCGVSTYAGKVNCNVVVAKECHADPSAISRNYKKELLALHEEVMGLKDSKAKKLDKPLTMSPTIMAFFAGLLLLVLLRILL